jgi:hypothetical protein
VALIVLFIVATVIIGPSFALLFTLQGRRMLDPAEPLPVSSRDVNAQIKQNEDG